MGERERISTVTAAFIIAIALILDLVQFLLVLTVVGSVVSVIIGLLAGFGLWLVFALHGVKYSGTGALKKAGATFGTMVAEMVPFLDVLPLITIGAVLIIRQTRKEDKAARQKARADLLAQQQAQYAQAQEMQASVAQQETA